jgi:hypothetical protein
MNAHPGMMIVGYAVFNAEESKTQVPLPGSISA